MRAPMAALFLMAGAAGSAATPSSLIVPRPDPWASVTAAIQAAQPQFPNGLCVEVATPAGVVYSRSFGGFTNQRAVEVASGSKWVTSAVILRLVDQGVLSLDTRTKDLLRDFRGNPWSGNMGEITLRQLLSFTSGISGDDANSESVVITLARAVEDIYQDQSATASAPGSSFYYGSTHMRIAARMAEVATGKSWKQIFDEQFRVPMGWSADSIYSNGGPNPNPAGGLTCTGLEYMRFLEMELRGGVDGTRRFLSPAAVSAQRRDGFGPATTIAYSPFLEQMGKAYHYALGNWLGTANGQGPSLTNPVTWYGSTGTFGWAPWVTADGSYAGLIMTRQPEPNSGMVSENLKAQLDGLIRQALSQNPPVIRP